MLTGILTERKFVFAASGYYGHSTTNNISEFRISIADAPVLQLARLCENHMKQISLEMELSRLTKLNNRSPLMEQYPTPPDIAAKMLYRALGDGCLKGMTVADLGCGNGTFAVGALMLGAEKAYAIDIDQNAISVAGENSRQFGDRIILLKEDIEEFDVPVDTILMNPPFGSQRRNADLPFIEKALEYSKDFYIVLNYKAGDFLEKVIKGKGEIIWEENIEIPLAHTYEFHRKEIKMIQAKMSRVKVW